MWVASERRCWIARVLLTCAVLLGALWTASVPASAADGGCREGTYSGGEYLICLPEEGAWNGDLVVYAHGYVAPANPVGIPEDQLVLEDGTSITNTVTSLGYAFAATSYSTNGLAIKEGPAELVDLVATFETTQGVTPAHVYLVGASEGGAITALAVEEHPDVFDGGLATCGPVGDFRRQVDYWGDVRVLFDTFFPDVLPAFEAGADPLIPPEVIDGWYWCGDPERNPNYGCAEDREEAYETRVREALLAHPGQTRQLLRVARVPTDRTDPGTGIDALVQLLWYNVFATNDAVVKLGGHPYDNTPRWYWGSSNDWRLNRSVERFDADQTAIDEIEGYYQTSGDLSAPIVTLHTLRDPIVPYWHEPIYRWKVWTNDDQALHAAIPGLRYGHCNFGAGEVLFAFGLLVYKAEGSGLTNVWDVLTPAQEEEYIRTADVYGFDPAADDAGAIPTIDRDEEPVVVKGADLADLSEAPTDDLFVYAYRDGALRQIPFQVDEIVSDVYTSTVGNPLDADDEVVFMASDLGAQAPGPETLTPTLPISPTWYTIEVTDPLSPTAKGWAYVVRSSGLTETFTETYASFDPVTKRITTTAYTAGFLSAHPGFDYLELYGSEEDILDRTKIRVQSLLGTLTEEFFPSEPPSAIKNGPIRVIVRKRGTMGYRSMLQTWLREDLAGATATRLSTDFNANAVGATFFDANTPAGVTVDGSPDEVAASPLSPWWQVSHSTGTLVQVSDSSGVGGDQTTYYEDDGTVDPNDTGDGMSYGDVGLAAQSPNSTVAYQTAIYVLPPGLMNVGELYAAYAANPLQVTATVGSGERYSVYLPLVVRQ